MTLKNKIRRAFARRIFYCACDVRYDRAIIFESFCFDRFQVCQEGLTKRKAGKALSFAGRKSTGLFDHFCNGAFEEADHSAEDGKNAADDSTDCKLFIEEKQERVFRIRSETDSGKSGSAEEKYRTDYETSRSDDFTDKAFACDQGNDASQQGQDKCERYHDVELKNFDRNAGDIGVFTAESEIHSRYRDCRAPDFSDVSYCIQEHHAERCYP